METVLAECIEAAAKGADPKGAVGIGIKRPNLIG